MAETKVTFVGEIERNAMTTWSPVLTNMTLGDGTVVAKYTQFAQSLGTANCWDTSASVQYPGPCMWISATTARLYATTGTPSSLNAITATNPTTFAVGDQLSASGFYEAA